VSRHRSSPAWPTSGCWRIPIWSNSPRCAP
jgi:hypothetical protein